MPEPTTLHRLPAPILVCIVCEAVRDTAKPGRRCTECRCSLIAVVDKDDAKLVFDAVHHAYSDLSAMTKRYDALKVTAASEIRRLRLYAVALLFISGIAGFFFGVLTAVLGGGQ
jgi:hypothetical protein